MVLPPSLATLLAGYRLTPVQSGESGGTVYRCDDADRPPLFLKRARVVSAAIPPTSLRGCAGWRVGCLCQRCITLRGTPTPRGC